MAGITLADAEAQLAIWIAASTAVASSQSYQVDSGNGRRTLTRADAAEIKGMIEFWDRKVKQLSGAASGQRRVRYTVPD